MRGYSLDLQGAATFGDRPGLAGFWDAATLSIVEGAGGNASRAPRLLGETPSFEFGGTCDMVRTLKGSFTHRRCESDSEAFVRYAIKRRC